MTSKQIGQLDKNSVQKQDLPFLVPILNPLIKGLLHIGVPMGSMALLTVKGRKTGKQRTTPVAVLKMDENRYIVSVYGLSSWVRNLRATGHAKLAHGLHSEQISVVELTPQQSAPILKHAVSIAPGFLRKHFNATAESPIEDFEGDAANHPVFLVS